MGLGKAWRHCKLPKWGLCRKPILEYLRIPKTAFGEHFVSQKFFLQVAHNSRVFQVQRIPWIFQVCWHPVIRLCWCTPRPSTKLETALLNLILTQTCPLIFWTENSPNQYSCPEKRLHIFCFESQVLVQDGLVGRWAIWEYYQGSWIIKWSKLSKGNHWM